MNGRKQKKLTYETIKYITHNCMNVRGNSPFQTSRNNYNKIIFYNKISLLHINRQQIYIICIYIFIILYLFLIGFSST